MLHCTHRICIYEPHQAVCPERFYPHETLAGVLAKADPTRNAGNKARLLYPLLNFGIVPTLSSSPPTLHFSITPYLRLFHVYILHIYALVLPLLSLPSRDIRNPTSKNVISS